MEKSAFGESLKEILAERNIRPAGFAEEIGVSPATVYSWMSGATEPNLSALVRMADSLACSVDFLAGRSAENYPCASRAPLPPFAERVRAVMRECGISSYRLAGSPSMTAPIFTIGNTARNRGFPRWRNSPACSIAPSII